MTRPNTPAHAASFHIRNAAAVLRGASLDDMEAQWLLGDLAQLEGTVKMRHTITDEADEPQEMPEDDTHFHGNYQEAFKDLLSRVEALESFSDEVTATISDIAELQNKHIHDAEAPHPGHTHPEAAHDHNSKYAHKGNFEKHYHNEYGHLRWDHNRIPAEAYEQREEGTYTVEPEEVGPAEWVRRNLS